MPHQGGACFRNHAGITSHWLRGPCGARTRACRVPTHRDAYRTYSKTRPDESGRGRLRVCAMSVAEKSFLRGPLAPQERQTVAHGVSRGNRHETDSAPEILPNGMPDRRKRPFFELGLRPKPRGLPLCGQDHLIERVAEGTSENSLPPRSRHRCERSGCSSAVPYPPHRQLRLCSLPQSCQA